MALFTISDLHLSLGTNKSMDAFPGWRDYVRRIEENWSACVSPQDTVVMPGDFSWGMTLEESLPDFRFVDRLPGRKILLKGNHDFWWNSLKKTAEFWQENDIHTLSLLQNDCAEVDGAVICGARGWFFSDAQQYSEKIAKREVLRLELSLQAAAEKTGERIVFLHFPPVLGDKVCEPLVELMERFDVRRCFYGHLHGYAAVTAFRGTCRGIAFTPVSADYLHFTPVKIEI